MISVQLLGYDFEHMLGQAFCRATLYFVSLEKLGRLLNQFFGFFVILIVDVGVIEGIFQPGADELEFSKIDYEPLFIEFFAPEGKGKAPVVTMDEAAVSTVGMLPVSKGNV